MPEEIKPKKPKRGRQGEGGGRPPKYEDSEVLGIQILKYFDSCESSRTIPNKAGLCVFLHISRETYNQYKTRFPDALKAVEDYIENAWVQRLAGNSPTGAIFYLKNAFSRDYRDKHETDLTSGGEKIVGINYIKPKDGDNNRADN